MMPASKAGKAVTNGEHSISCSGTGGSALLEPQLVLTVSQVRFPFWCKMHLQRSDYPIDSISLS